MATSVRVKVCFEPSSILSAKLRQEDSSLYWFLIPAEATKIEEVEQAIVSTFDIREGRKHGIKLLVDGCVFLPSNPVSLIRDGDILQVQTRKSFDLQSGKNLLIADGDNIKPKARTSISPRDKKPNRKTERKAGLAQKVQNRNVENDSLISDGDHKSVEGEDVNGDRLELEEEPHLKAIKKKKRKNPEEVKTPVTPVVNEENSEEDDDDNSSDRNIEPKSCSEVVKKDREGPGRSSRRKKEKRERIRKQKESEREQEYQKILSRRPPQTSPETQLTKRGHVRFSEDGEPVLVEPSEKPPEINIRAMASKKHGQSWGQQKTFPGNITAFHKEDLPEASLQTAEGQTEAEEEMVPETEQDQKRESEAEAELRYKSLPGLVGEPKVGDIIAYRLVQLSPSLTPEISNFREGRVSSFDRNSGALVLQPTDTFLNLVKVSQVNEDTETPEDHSEFPFPYLSDGTLETEVDSLTDIRLAQPSPLTPSNLPSAPAPSPLGALPQIQPNEVWAKLLAASNTRTTPSDSSLAESKGDSAPSSLPPPTIDLNFVPRKEISPERVGQSPFLSGTPANTPLGQGNTSKGPDWSHLRVALEEAQGWSPGAFSVHGSGEGEKEMAVSPMWVDFADVSMEIERRKGELTGEVQSELKEGNGGAVQGEEKALEGAVEVGNVEGGLEVKDVVQVLRKEGEKKGGGRTWRAAGIGPTLARLRAGNFDAEKKGE